MGWLHADLERLRHVLKASRQLKNACVLALISLGAILVEGYHPGVEDDAVYLSAIQRRLNPALYPHDAKLFTLQMQASVFDKMMAGWVRVTHMPLAWAELLGQFLAAFFLLWGCWRIARQCFASAAGQWAGVALVGALFSLPVAGTALYIVDQYLHPRAIATGLILAAIVAILERRVALGSVLLAAAVVMHPIMGAFGVSYCAILWFAERRGAWRPRAGNAAALAVGIVPAWIFEKPSPAWRAALDTRNYYFLGRWAWYEWLGAIAPILILWAMACWARRVDRPAMARLAGCAAVFAVFQLAVGCLVLLTPGLIRLMPMQPMRYLHLVYVLMAILGGGLLGEKVLQRHAWRWAVFFLPLAAGMFWAQRGLFAGTEHVELPGVASQNPWLEAFAWVRANTPVDAYFALDPDYMELPEEDFHSFRALAERSELADWVKDAAVATQVPDLAPLWVEQTQAAWGWKRFGKQDFEGLRQRFGVDWIVVRGRGVEGLECPYERDGVAACRL